MAKNQQRRRDAEQEPDEEDVFESYANSVTFAVGAFDVSLDFGLRHGNAQPETKARINMSLEHAWVMIKLMDRIFQQYRQAGGKFSMPADVLTQLGLTDEYREDFGEP